MSNRTEIIRTMLERYAELSEQSETGRLAGGSGTGLALTPHEARCALVSEHSSVNRCTCAYRGVRELERLLRVMREDRQESLVLIAPGTKCSVRSLWWNLNQRYIAAQTRTVDRPVTQRGKNGKRLTLIVRQVEAVYPKTVDPRKVDAGIQYLASNWGLAQEPFLPSELLVAA